MKRLTTLLVLTLLVGASSCTKVIHEVATRNKRAPLARNILLFSSETPADIRIAYYATEDGVTNRLIEKEVQTPYVLELEDAVAIYDSMDVYVGNNLWKCYNDDNFRRYKQTREHEGPEYLRVENLSDQVVKLAAIDAEELKTEWVPEYEETVIERHPLPLYRGVPLLYLFMPDRAPGRELGYVAMTEYEHSERGIHTAKAIKSIPLFPDRLGDFTAADLPFSMERIMELYEREMAHLLVSYKHYSIVEQLGVSGIEFQNAFAERLRFKRVEAVTRIAPHSTLTNEGNVPILAIDFRNDAKWEEKDYRKW